MKEKLGKKFIAEANGTGFTSFFLRVFFFCILHREHVAYYCWDSSTFEYGICKCLCVNVWGERRADIHTAVPRTRTTFYCFLLVWHQAYKYSMERWSISMFGLSLLSFIAHTRNCCWLAAIAAPTTQLYRNVLHDAHAHQHILRDCFIGMTNKKVYNWIYSGREHTGTALCIISKWNETFDSEPTNDRTDRYVNVVTE